MDAPIHDTPIESALRSVHLSGVQLALPVREALGPGSSKTHLPTSAPFRAQPPPVVSDRFPRDRRSGGAAASRSQVPSPFGHRHSLLEHPVPAEGFRPSHDRPTGPKAGPDGVSTFHAHELRPGEGAHSTPRPALFARPARGLRSPPLPGPIIRVLDPSSRASDSEASSRVHPHSPVRPSPPGRSPDGTGALGLLPELRTPTGRTRRRTSGRGSVANTNREPRDRLCRPPIHELTHMRDIVSHPQVLIIALKRSPVSRTGQLSVAVRPVGVPV